MAKFLDVFFDATKDGCKIPKEKYLPQGLYPIVDQGQGDIAGYSNSSDGLYKDVPAIVFGDHTRIIKYVDTPFFLGADGVKLLKAKIPTANYKYLFYALSAAKIPDTGYNRHFKWLKEIDIPIPSPDEQRRIAAILDKVTSLIALRKQQLAKLDELVKARFVEMFGDPETNPMNWTKVNISTVINGKASNGFFAKRDEYCDSGNIEILGVTNIVNRMYSNIEGLPRTHGTENDKQRYMVKYGDILFCRSSLVAEGIGKASIVPPNIPENVLFECHVIRLPLDLSKCVPEFIQVLTTTDFFRQQIISQSKTSTMTTIGQGGILQSTIILPPTELQKNFRYFVQKNNQCVLTIQENLDILGVVKKKLTQIYFG